MSPSGIAKRPPRISISAVHGGVAAPVGGVVVPLSDVPDPVFAGGLLGPGCGIRPSDEVLYAPAGGIVTCTTPSNHAIGITTSEGVEILIHIGTDTVEMRGVGFERYIQQGEPVSAGESLVKFDRRAIADAGYDDTVMVVISNASSPDSVNVVAEGSVDAGSDLLRIVS